MSSVSSSSTQSSIDHKKQKKRHSSSSKNNKRDRKHKEHRRSHDKKRKKSSSYDDDDRHKKRKHDKERSSRHSKKKKESKRSDDKKSKKKHEVTTLQKILGDVQNKPPQNKIHKTESYFSHNSHFRLYLYYKKNGIYFEDLTTKESHSLFHSFVKEYNAGSLEQVFYKEDIPVDLLEDCKLRSTQYDWKIRASERERSVLDQVKHRVRDQTEGTADTTFAVPCMPCTTTTTVSNKTFSASTSNQNKEQRLNDRRANKRLRTHVKTVEEELTGGKPEVGTYAHTIQKRKELSNKLHASAKHKEDAMTGVELNDEDIYGSTGNNDFQQALASEKRRNERRTEGRVKRLKELEKKEEGKKDAMMKMLGLGNLKPGQKITIQPRND